MPVCVGIEGGICLYSLYSIKLLLILLSLLVSFLPGCMFGLKKSTVARKRYSIFVATVVCELEKKEGA